MMSSALQRTLSQLLGAERLQLVDVGARDGIDKRWLPFAPVLNVAAFEPDPDECARLNAKASSLSYPIRYLAEALGSKEGQSATLHICHQPGCSSLYRPNLALCNAYHYGPSLEVVKTFDMTLNRMDTVLGREGIAPDVLKIDTQGFELEILKGAGALLRQVMVVELEVEFVHQYIDQPLFADVDAFMRSQGFTLRGIKRTYWRRKIPADWQYSARGGQLIHGDALYVNAGLVEGAAAENLRVLGKALIALAAYDQHDLILNLLSGAAGKVGELSDETRRSLAQELTRSPPAPFYARLLGPLLRSEAHRKVRAAIDAVRRRDASDWHDPDFF